MYVVYLFIFILKGNKKPFVNSPSSASQGKDKKLKYNQDVNEDDDDDYEPTGKKHALKKYDQFALNTSCFWGRPDQIIPKLCDLMKFLLQK